MGGIAGVLNIDGRRIDSALLEGMLCAIRHRGPQDSGTFQDEHAGLVNARTGSTGPGAGRHPMPNADRTKWLTFDGEIYNDAGLRNDLARRGHVFSTNSDAEVVLAAYEEFGEDCVRLFNGEWSLAIWDSRRRRLFASRDRLGIRPFYYADAGGEFVFASEIKALWQHAGLAREIDLVGLDQFFTLRATLPPRTVFRNIFELPPGFSLHWSDGVLQVFRHWQIEFCPDSAQDDRLVEERLCELLTDATRLRLRSNSRAATWAESGIASLLTTALARRSAETPPAALSIAFAETETADARPTLELDSPGEIDRQTLRCTPAELGRAFPEAIEHAETPLLTTDAAAAFLLSRFARDEGCDALLAGAGGDELFGGCAIYKTAKVRRFWSRQPDSPFRIELLERLYCDEPGLGSKSPAYWQAFLHTRPGDLTNPFFSHLAAWERTMRLRTFFSENARAEIGDYDAREELRLRLPGGFKHADLLSQAQFIEITSHLSGGVLSQLDRMSMAHGVAARFPFLDHRVAAVAARLPAHCKLRGLSEQESLKRIASRFIPAPDMRPRRPADRQSAAACFFGAPDDPRPCDFADELVSRERIADAGIFDADAVERIVRKARRGEALGPRDDMALAGILSTQLLVDKFIRASRREMVCGFLQPATHSPSLPV